MREFVGLLFSGRTESAGAWIVVIGVVVALFSALGAEWPFVVAGVVVAAVGWALVRGSRRAEEAP